MECKNVPGVFHEEMENMILIFIILYIVCVYCVCDRSSYEQPRVS